MNGRALMGLAALLGLAVLLAAAAVAPRHATAASPTVSPAPSTAPSAEPIGDPGFPIEAWLDRALPTSAAPGMTVPVGITIWDRTAGRLAPAQSLQLWWYPATGDGPPTHATIIADWNGHGLASIAVPDGGGGRIGVGFLGTACASDGCQPTTSQFPIGGVGPPPDAPLTQITGVDIRTDGAVVAGRPSIVSIVLRPKADWSPSDVPLPDQLVVRARIPRGAPLATATATLAEPAERSYRAEIRLPDPGDYILDVATSPDPSPDEVFSGSLVTVTALPADQATPESAPGSGGAGDGSGLIVPIALALVGLAMIGGLVLVVRRSP